MDTAHHPARYAYSHRGTQIPEVLIEITVLCDRCASLYKASRMLLAEIDRETEGFPILGYVCQDPSCGRQFTWISGYRDEEPNSPSRKLAVHCGCHADRPIMHIDQVDEDRGGVRFRCRECGATKQAQNTLDEFQC